MSNLVAIIRATRKSAKAIDRMARTGRIYRETQTPEALKAYRRACADYTRAQATLAANPLPGDAR